MNISTAAFEAQGPAVAVSARWNGFGAQKGLATLPSGSLDDTVRVDYAFAPLPGIFPATAQVKTARWVLTLYPQGDAFGKVLRDNPPTLTLGSWHGVRRQCRESDFAM